MQRVLTRMHDRWSDECDECWKILQTCGRCRRRLDRTGVRVPAGVLIGTYLRAPTIRYFFCAEHAPPTKRKEEQKQC